MISSPGKDQEPSVSDRELSPRATGTIILVCGVVLAYIGIYWPYADIQNNAAEIRYYAAAFIGGPAGIGLGLIYAVFGDLAEKHLGDPQRPTTAGIVVTLALIGAGVAMHLWFQGYIEASGYGS